MTLWGALMAPASRLDGQNKSGSTGRSRLTVECGKARRGKARQGKEKEQPSRGTIPRRGLAVNGACVEVNFRLVARKSGDLTDPLEFAYKFSRLIGAEGDLRADKNPAGRSRRHVGLCCKYDVHVHIYILVKRRLDGKTPGISG
ncbi:hypothetical protein O3P69_000721 [Scylla paramamosain]|uniref:Uncharacterized protein n=1 Tax=Scylla paramamosain TaxID=85552 RepID=A0AAW0UR26_SCYPA